jgi:hypothetical protein
MIRVPSPLAKGPQAERERKKRVNHRFHRLHRLGNEVGVWARDGLPRERLYLN